MIAVGKFAFNERDVQYLRWTKPDGFLMVEFYDGNYVLIKNEELAYVVWHCLTDHKTRFDAGVGEIEWVDGETRLLHNN